ncbi:hypothetical protein Tco_1411100 [Tanacetum coccineum]
MVIVTVGIEAAKFVRDFKSLTKEADESLAKHKDLEFEIERLLRAVVSQDIMSIVQNPTVVETSDLQTELERNLNLNSVMKKENKLKMADTQAEIILIQVFPEPSSTTSIKQALCKGIWDNVNAHARIR